MEEQRYASMRWNSRWNDNSRGACAAISQNGSDVMLVTVMGSICFDLSREGDVQSFYHQMKVALDLLKKTKSEHDTAMLALET